MLSCKCDEWSDAMIQIVEAQIWRDKKGFPYTGKQFKYCPWCGKLLQNLEKENFSSALG